MKFKTIRPILEKIADPRIVVVTTIGTDCRSAWLLFSRAVALGGHCQKVMGKRLVPKQVARRSESWKDRRNPRNAAALRGAAALP
jgi:hypothetical protein